MEVTASSSESATRAAGAVYANEHDQEPAITPVMVIKMEYEAEDTCTTQELNVELVHLPKDVLTDGDRFIKEEDNFIMKTEDETTEMIIKQELDIEPTVLQQQPALQAEADPDPRCSTSSGGGGTPALLCKVAVPQKLQIKAKHDCFEKGSTVTPKRKKMPQRKRKTLTGRKERERKRTETRQRRNLQQQFKGMKLRHAQRRRLLFAIPGVGSTGPNSVGPSMGGQTLPSRALADLALGKAQEAQRPPKGRRVTAFRVHEIPVGSRRVRSRLDLQQTPREHVLLIEAPPSPTLLEREELAQQLDTESHVAVLEWLDRLEEAEASKQQQPQEQQFGERFIDEQEYCDLAEAVPDSAPSTSHQRPRLVIRADSHDETSAGLQVEDIADAPLLEPPVSDGSESELEFFDDVDPDAVKPASAQETVLRGFSNDEELPPTVAQEVRVAEQMMDAEHEKLLGENMNFVWSVDFTTFEGKPEEFQISPNAQGAVKTYDHPCDAFVDIFNESIMTLIRDETNRYAEQCIAREIAKGKYDAKKRIYRWQPVTVDELYRLFAVFIYMGIAPLSRLSEYWKTTGALQMPEFRKLMSYNRYILLNKFLHFVNNEDTPPVPSTAPQGVDGGVGGIAGVQSGESLPRKLFKLHPIIKHLNAKFQSLYVLRRFIAVDDSLTLHKGRISFAEYISTKAARRGIKSFELCDSSSGYLSKFIIYGWAEGDGKDVKGEARGRGRGRGSTGGTVRRAVEGIRTSTTRGFTTGAIPTPKKRYTLLKALARKTTQIVLELLKGLENKGYCVTMDNFYNSPALARYLKSQSFDNLGTMRQNRSNVPKVLGEVTEDCARGEFVARHSGDITILSWKDVKVVTFISTYHDDTFYMETRAGEEFMKPAIVQDYNKIMGGVDLKDQKLSMYLTERKRGLKWYVKMFKRLMNAALHNSYILYRDKYEPTKTDKGHDKYPCTHRNVRYMIADELMKRYAKPTTLDCLPKIPKDRRLDWTLGHFPFKLDLPRRCKRCSALKVERRSVIKCTVCNVGLCTARPCFLEYHTLADLTTPTASSSNV